LTLVRKKLARQVRAVDPREREPVTAIVGHAQVPPLRGNIVRFLYLAVFSSFALAASSMENSVDKSQYAGQEQRSIKSLSKSDVEELRNGRGWGLAKAAELNGMPGPKHILELKNEIALTKVQEQAVEALFAEMKRDAIRLGGKLLELEKALDDSFAAATVTQSSLAELLGRIAVVRGDLRYVHLAAHLRTPNILTLEQVETYNRLRGYDSNDPCRKVPQGHDTQMWRRHNGCE
jgi:hypothetical protein